MYFREITPSKLRLGVRGIRLPSVANAQMQFEAAISLAQIFSSLYYLKFIKAACTVNASGLPFSVVSRLFEPYLKIPFSL